MKNRSVSMIILGFLGLVIFVLVIYIIKVSTKARIVVEWSTASELDTVGFNIFRSENANDTGTQVNTDLIPSGEDSQTGSNYKYTDENVQPGRVYYYYLEDVSADGTTNRHGPVVVEAQSSRKILWGVIVALAVIIFLSILFRYLRLRMKSS